MMKRIAFVLVVAMLSPLPAVVAAPVCRTIDVPVSLTAGGPADQTIATELCRPAGADTVHVLQAGATYGMAHWDFPYRPSRYSYVRALNAAGIATLNVDRLGIGESSHPPSALVTVENEAHILHQMITGLRLGGLGGTLFRPFASVVSVGNSLGSVIAVTEAARYGDVDGVIVTGANKNGNARELGLFASQASPALLDPRFAGRTYDPGYLTVPDETRCHVFWSERDRDCDGPVVTTDNSLKETVTAGEGIGAGSWVFSGEQGADAPQVPDTTAIRAPLLLVSGSEDLVECGEGTDCSSATSLLSTESRYYPNAASVEAFVLPGAGHVINVASNARDWFAASVEWTHRVVARGGPAAGGAIVQLPVAFSVTNVNRSRTVCSNDGKDYTVRGTMTMPASALSDGTHDAVTVYLHGAGDANSWNLQAFPKFDYLAAMARRGHTSVFLHTLGYGPSDEIDGFALCFGSVATMTDQVVRLLRAGKYDAGAAPPKRFERVALAGHSGGGIVAELYSVSFDSIDALIVAGWADTAPLLPAFYTGVGNLGAECAQGGRSKREGGPAGWGSGGTEEFIRAIAYNVDEAVVEEIFRTWERDPCGVGQDTGAAIAASSALASTVTVPVLLIYGDRDPWNGPQLELQRDRYTGSPDVSLAVLPDTGHMMMMGNTIGTFVATMSNWLSARNF